MKKFIIKDDFWQLFPQAQIGVLICEGINNQTSDEKSYFDMLRAAEKECLKYLDNEEFSQNQVIKVWREAFKKFKTKKGVRSSIEALIKRVHKGETIGNINPLVDIYNSISLKYALPCGGEDIDKFQGDVLLTLADGTEEFITYGSNESAPPYENELIYKDELGAICRCWNWRESVRTMLTEDTTRAFMVIELVDITRKDELINALNDLCLNIEENLGGKTRIELLNIDRKEIVIEESL